MAILEIDGKNSIIPINIKTNWTYYQLKLYCKKNDQFDFQLVKNLNELINEMIVIVLGNAIYFGLYGRVEGAFVIGRLR